MKTTDVRQMKLRALREIFGYTVEDVARETGCSTKTVYRYETGRYRFATKEIQKARSWYSKKKVEVLLNEKDLWEELWTEKENS